MQITTLLMHFVDEGGGKVTLSIDSPRANLTPLEVKEVMEAVITQKAIYGRIGELTAVHSAQVVTKITDTLMDS